MVEDVISDLCDVLVNMLQSTHIEMGAHIMLRETMTRFHVKSAGFYLFSPEKMELLCFEGEKPSGEVTLNIYKNALTNTVLQGVCTVFPLMEDGLYGAVELVWENPPSQKECDDAKTFFTQCSVVLNVLRDLQYQKERVLQHNTIVHTILDSLECHFCVVDVDDYTVKMTNSISGELPEVTCYTLFHKKKSPCNEFCPLNEMKRTHNPVKKEHIHYIQGQATYVKVHGYPIVDSNGTIIQALLYCLDITEQKKVEEELIRLSTAVKMSNDSIIITDIKGNIIDINDAVLTMYGARTKEKLVKKNVLCIVAPDDVKKVQALFEEVLTKRSVKNVEHDILLKNRTRITVETSIAVMKDTKGIPMGMVVITRDITERKKAENQMKKRSMKFNLKEGNVYLVKESVSGLSFNALKDLLKVGYPGFIISRTPKKKWHKIPDNVDYRWAAEKGESSVPPDLEKIGALIEGLPRNTAVLIDRLDYLLSKNRFSTVLSFIQCITETALIQDHVVIVSVDPSVLKKQELKQLEKETDEIELLHRKALSEDLVEILTFVYNQNISGTKPSYTRIGKEIGVSKPTARKRIKKLVNCGYLKESKKGRTKVMEITEKARSWF